MATESKNGPASSCGCVSLLKNMEKLQNSEFKNFFENIDAVMFDCDGVLWVESEVVSGADDLVKALRNLGKRVFFVTNNSTKPREELLNKFNNLGFEASMEEVVTSSYVAALHLKEMNFQKKVYVIGTRGVTKELEDVGIQSLPIGPDPMDQTLAQWFASDEVRHMKLEPEVGAVIVGFDEFFSYKKMFKAASYLKKNEIHFIATNTDEQFPGLKTDFVIPGTGSIVNGVKTAAGREPVIMGKPSRLMFDLIQRSHTLDPNRTLMVGDRGNTDILFGRKANVWTLLVLTGVTQLEEAQRWQSTGNEVEKQCVPHFYLNNVGNLLELMKKNGFC